MGEPDRRSNSFSDSPGPLGEGQSRELSDLLRKTGAASFDELPAAAQAIVRAHWDQQIADDVASLNLTAALRASGKPFYTADAAGNVIVHDPQHHE